jgi:uncharacterized protein (UPF0333 family)
MNTMNKQRGSVVGWVLGGLFLLILVSCLIFTGLAISKRNSFVRIENNIVIGYEESKNVHSNYVLRIQEMAQVPKMATKQLSEVIKASNEGRYGPDGSKAVFQFLKEQNPNIPDSLYTNIQKEVAGGRLDFQSKITRVNDNKGVAYNMLDDTIGGFILKDIWGLPRKNIGYEGGKDDYPVIMSETSVETYKTGVDKGVNML